MDQGARITGGSDDLGMSRTQAAGYCVGDLIVDVRRERVTREGCEIPLAKLSFDLLLTLIREAPDLVSVQSLMQQVWPGLVVGPETVSQRIKLIREALDDDPKQPRYIAGVRGRGYRLVALVEPHHAESPHVSFADEHRASAPSVTDMPASTGGVQRSTGRVLRAFGIAVCGALILVSGYLLWDRRLATVPAQTRAPDNTSVVVAMPTIAVLPFADMSPNRDQEYFADGLSEELSDHLSRLSGLHVVGRTSAFSFKGKHEDLRTIANALGVKHILEGSVRRAGDQLRITAQLVDSNGTRVWSNTYDQNLGDVFAIQDAVAKSVAVALSVTLAAGDSDIARGGTRNVEAYDAYLAGKAIMASGALDDLRRGLEYLERAVMLDPRFALAWSELAKTYQGEGTLPERGGAEWNARALRASSRALELAPDLPSVLAAAALIAAERKDWAEAERRLQKARAFVTGSENVWEHSGWFCVTVGRPRESVEYFHRGYLAEPLLALFPVWTATAYEMSGDLDKAAVELARAAPLYGRRSFLEYNLLTQAQERRDRAQIEKVISDSPSGLHDRDVLNRAMQSRLDQPQAALAELRRIAVEPGFPKTLVAVSTLANWAAYFGDPEFSLRLLHNASTDASFAFVLWRPVLKDMRRLPGFKNMVRELGLVDYWRASGNWGEFCRPIGKDDFACT